jgi:hypothetical protein
MPAHSTRPAESCGLTRNQPCDVQRRRCWVTFQAKGQPIEAQKDLTSGPCMTQPA